MVGFGPLPTSIIGDGSPSQAQVVYDLGPGSDTLTSASITYDVARAGVGGVGWEFGVWWYDALGAFLVKTSTGYIPIAPASATYVEEFTAPAGAAEAKVFSYGHFPVGSFLSGTINGSITTQSNYCEYGTRMQGGTPTSIFIDMGVITAAVAYFGGPWLMPIFIGFLGATYDIALLCNAPRPIMPPIPAGPVLILSPWSILLQQYLWDAF